MCQYRNISILRRPRIEKAGWDDHACDASVVEGFPPLRGVLGPKGSRQQGLS